MIYFKTLHELIIKNMDKYIEFLKNKEVRITKTGFDINDNDMNPLLFDFQK